MGRKRKHQQTEMVTEAASSSTAKARLSNGGGKRSRQMTVCPDVDLVSSAYTSNVTIHQLDDLPLTVTFGNLDTKTKASVARVCKRWRDLVDSPAVWKHTTVRLNPRSLTSAHLDSLKRRGIQRVMVTKYTSGKKLRMLIYGLPSLETLDIHHIKMTKGMLASVFPEALPSLKRLVLKLDILGVERMEYIGHIFQNLRNLDLFVHGIDELSSVPDQVGKMSCLTSLVILLMAIGDQMLHFLSQACPNLKVLLARLQSDVTDVGMQQLAQLEEIRQLHLLCYRFPSLSNTLTAKLQNLDVMNVLGSPSAGDEQLEALAQLPELEELEIGSRNITMEGWRALGMGFRRLKCLSLRNVHFSKDTEVEHFGSLLSLEKIVFASLHATDLQMKSLCCALKHVHSMTIDSGPKITQQIMKDIADMENLKELSFHSIQIDDKALTQLADGKAPLETLTLDGCECNLKECLLYIAQHKHSLRQLEVYMKVESAVLSQIVTDLPGLRVLGTSAHALTRRKLQCLKPGLIIHGTDAHEEKVTIHF